MSSTAGLPKQNAQCSVRPEVVVVTPPVGDGVAGLLQSLEPMLAQTFVAKLAVDARDLAVLHWLALYDEQAPEMVNLRPGNEYSAGEHPNSLERLIAS